MAAIGFGMECKALTNLVRSQHQTSLRALTSPRCRSGTVAGPSTPVLSYGERLPPLGLADASGSTRARANRLRPEKVPHARAAAGRVAQRSEFAHNPWQVRGRAACAWLCGYAMPVRACFYIFDRTRALVGSLRLHVLLLTDRDILGYMHGPATGPKARYALHVASRNRML
eukprot:3772262-Pleurochrysis_carterae.AAC.2